MTLLTAQQAARRLGVKVETVYAYVSRGVLHSRPVPGSRSSGFDPREVEAVARRGRPRRTTHPAAVDVVIETHLTAVTGGRPRFRGRDVLDLATKEPFEAVAELLWTGTLAPPTAGWRALPVSVPAQPTTRDQVRAAVVLAGAADAEIGGLDAVAVADTGRRLIATVVDALPPLGDGRTPRLLLPDSEPLRGSVAGRMWARLAPTRPRPGMLPALNAALVVLADHEMAASTLAARIAASTRADPYSVVLSGLGALAGPLHGGASRLACELIDHSLRDGPVVALDDSRRTHGHAPGFGHQLYPDGDPRGRLLLDLVRRAAPGDPVVSAADEVVTAARGRLNVEPNVDFGLAVLTRVNRMPADGGETIFTVARTAGWLAHAIEEYAERPLRFRGRATYVAV
jgi:citrate synthase